MCNLEGTHARIVTERQNTTAQHIELWEKYKNDFLQSEFEKYVVDEADCSWAKDRFLLFRRKRVRDISDFVSITMERSREREDGGVINVEETLRMIDRSHDLDVYQLYNMLHAKDQVVTLASVFLTHTFGYELIKSVFPRDKVKNIMGKKSQIKKTC